MEREIQIADVLLDSLPFIREFRGKTIVIKYGGAAQSDSRLKELFAKDIATLYMLGIKPVIIHGGEKDINTMLEECKIKTEFIDGDRISTQESMPIIEMVLSGKINKELSVFLNHYGIKAVGISGKDGNLFQAVQKDEGKFGYTGKITEVNPALLNVLLQNDFVPVIAPIAASSELNHLGYNISADMVACKIAKALNAFKIIFLTDVAGVLDKSGELFSVLNENKILELKEEGVISADMLPKVEASLECIKNGVKKAHIIDGRIEHSLLLELFTSSGIGTEIV